MSAVFWHLVEALLVVGGAWLVGDWAGGAMNATLSHTPADPQLRMAAARAMRPLFLVLGALCALSLLGVDTSAFLIVLAGLCLGGGLALRGPLEDLLSGAALLSLQPFGSGDQVALGDVEGKVVAVGLLVTVLSTEDGEVLMLRNREVWPVRNRSRRVSSVTATMASASDGEAESFRDEAAVEVEEGALPLDVTEEA